MQYVRRTRLVEDRFGEGKWQTINLEEVFTALEVEPEFQNTESALAGHLLLARNELVHYIRRIIGFCTQGTFGNYYKALAETINPNDSVITFNWDLLLDQKFLEPITGILTKQYSKSFTTAQAAEGIRRRFGPGEGFYLKLHGSLNWFPMREWQVSIKPRNYFRVGDAELLIPRRRHRRAPFVISAAVR
jgi:hypothetical protein